MIYLELFWVFFQVGLMSFGGGMASLPIIQGLVVDTRGWITIETFTDIITISEMTPGPIAINAATFVGNQIAGVWGGILATVACLLPSTLIVVMLAFLYFKFKKLTVVNNVIAILKPATIGFIAAAGLVIIKLSFFAGGVFSFDIANLNYVSVFIFALSIILLRKYKFSPIRVMAISGLIGILFYYLLQV